MILLRPEVRISELLMSGLLNVPDVKKMFFTETNFLNLLKLKLIFGIY